MWIPSSFPLFYLSQLPPLGAFITVCPHEQADSSLPLVTMSFRSLVFLTGQVLTQLDLCVIGYSDDVQLLSTQHVLRVATFYLPQLGQFSHSCTVHTGGLRYATSHSPSWASRGDDWQLLRGHDGHLQWSSYCWEIVLFPAGISSWLGVVGLKKTCDQKLSSVCCSRSPHLFQHCSADVCYVRISGS